MIFGEFWIFIFQYFNYNAYIEIRQIPCFGKEIALFIFNES